MKRFALILLLASESIASQIDQLNTKSPHQKKYKGVEEKIWDIKITLSGNTTEQHDQMLAKADSKRSSLML
jgi:hypothetical protein